MWEIDPKVNAWLVRFRDREAWKRWAEAGVVSLDVLTRREARRLAEVLGEDAGRWEVWKFKFGAKELLEGEARRVGRIRAAIAKFSGRESLHDFPVRKGDVVITKAQGKRFLLGEIADEHMRISGQFLQRKVSWLKGRLYTLEELTEGQEALKKRLRAPGALVRASEFLLTGLASRLFPRQAEEYRKCVHPTAEEVLEHLGFLDYEPFMRIEGDSFDFLKFQTGGTEYTVIVLFDKHRWALLRINPYTDKPELIQEGFYHKPRPEELLSKEDLTVDELLKYF